MMEPLSVVKLYKSMKRIAIFISGSGTNMVALTKAIHEHKLQAELVEIICDNPKAKGIQKAKDLGLNIRLIEWKEESILTLINDLKAKHIDYIILAGFMRIIPSYFVDAFAKHIINIHPSLLPKYKGLNAIERSYEAGDDKVGISIHYVDNGIDTGPLIAQFSTPRLPHDSLKDIEAKIHQLEHHHYYQTLQTIFTKETSS